VRVLIHSNAPWINSGYGVQTALLAPRLRELGHTVAVSSITGLQGTATKWSGIDVYPSGQLAFSPDTLLEHAAAFRADVIITCMDFRMLRPAAPNLRGIRVLAWLPVDTFPLSAEDRAVLLESGARPVAMSRFGEFQIEHAGFASAVYAPHMVDRSVYQPPAGAAERKQLRADAGIPDDAFVIGICAANSDQLRKGFPEQFEAFRRFAGGRPDARLLVHSVMHTSHGVHLGQLAEDMEIADRVIFSDTYAQVAGFMDGPTMAGWYGCCDVLSLCSYGEGFGVPLIEAQACGVPVIATAGSAMTELSVKGWRVKATPFWNHTHRAWWTRPDVADIARCYKEAYRVMRSKMGPRRRVDAVEFAAEYDADTVVDRYWRPILDALVAEPFEATGDQQAVES